MSLVLIGFSIDLGTEPKAAWWRMRSFPLQALSQSSMLVISPSINLKLGLSRKISMFSFFPVIRLSKQVILLFF